MSYVLTVVAGLLFGMWLMARLLPDSRDHPTGLLWLGLGVGLLYGVTGLSDVPHRDMSTVRLFADYVAHGGGLCLAWVMSGELQPRVKKAWKQ